MNYKKGKERNQIQIITLEQFIPENSEVRVIDWIIESADVKALGIKEGKNEKIGRKSYNPKDMLKLYIYGYLNGIRSSRQLAKQAKINMEIRWLLKELEPKHSAIADFRKENIESFELLFKNLIRVCDKIDLLGKRVVAIDGTKIRANAGKSKYYTQKKLEIMQQLANEKIEEYIKRLDKNDTDEELKRKLDNLKKRKKKYEEIQDELNENGSFSMTDKDAKSMKTGNTKGTIVGYNVQSTVDEKNKLIINYDVKSKGTDQGLLLEEALKAKNILGTETIEVLADKGYYKLEDIISCEENGIEVYVPKPKVNNQYLEIDYTKEHFRYDVKKDVYICPEGKELNNHTIKEGIKKRYFNYKACENCQSHERCTKSPKGRQINRYPKEEKAEEIAKRLSENIDKYKKRQQLVEHPFGTIKRAMNFEYFLLRGKKAVSGEIGLIFFCYNLKRMINIKGMNGLVKSILTLLIPQNQYFVCWTR